MRLFRCGHCGQRLYFENTHCEQCRRALGYWPPEGLLTLLPAGADRWLVEGAPEQLYRYCANAGEAGCNWLVAAEGEGQLCRACALNRTIPDLAHANNRALWRVLEQAKRRLVYSLLRLRLPLCSKAEDAEHGLAFDFLAEANPKFREQPEVLTGHAEGVITLNIAEADSVERERERQSMAEPYRSVLGHFRHEVGHYYWMRLVADSDWLTPFRECFGDETQDYAAALEAHYRGAANGWQAQYVSAYASAHPWEDWAESWAHYLHIVDVLETADAFGVVVQQPGKVERQAFDAYCEEDFDALVEAWLPLCAAVNSINRSMGQPDLYPFVLAEPVLDKLRFVHRVIGREREAAG